MSLKEYSMGSSINLQFFLIGKIHFHRCVDSYSLASPWDLSSMSEFDTAIRSRKYYTESSAPWFWFPKSAFPYIPD